MSKISDSIAGEKLTSSLSPIRFKTYNLIERAIEEGLEYGYHRAHKHTDNPNEHALIHEMQLAIMLELSEIIDFNEEGY